MLNWKNKFGLIGNKKCNKIKICSNSRNLKLLNLLKNYNYSYI